MSKIAIGKKLLTPLEFDNMWNNMELTNIELYLPNGEKATYSADDYSVFIHENHITVIDNNMRRIVFYDTHNDKIVVAYYYQAREAETA